MLCGHARHGHGSSTGPASVDVVHATNFVAPPSARPVVVTVHDLAFAHSPELCRPETLAYEPLLRQAIERGALVHTVSDFVAAEVRDYFALPDERVVRVYAGIARDRQAATRRRVDSSPAVPPTSWQWAPSSRARTCRCSCARSTSWPQPTTTRCSSSPDPDGWGSQAFDDAVSRARFGERVRRLGYVTNAQRADLLAGASVLAYPSLYEGFGHPPFEAMAAGVPVVTTRAGALPEAVGDAALLVDPTDVDALADALGRVLDDPALRARCSCSRGYERVQDFSWATAVDEFVAVYRRAIG